MYLIRTIITGDSDWLIVVCFMTVKSMLTILFFALEIKFFLKLKVMRKEFNGFFIIKQVEKP